MTREEEKIFPKEMFIVLDRKSTRHVATGVAGSSLRAGGGRPGILLVRAKQG